MTAPLDPYRDATLSRLTTAQIRDHILSLTPLGAPTKDIHRIKVEYLTEKERREASPEYVECPRCREHHGDLISYQHICMRCAETMLFEYPHHPFTLELEQARGFMRKELDSS